MPELAVVGDITPIDDLAVPAFSELVQSLGPERVIVTYAAASKPARHISLAADADESARGKPVAVFSVFENVVDTNGDPISRMLESKLFLSLAHPAHSAADHRLLMFSGGSGVIKTSDHTGLALGLVLQSFDRFAASPEAGHESDAMSQLLQRGVQVVGLYDGRAGLKQTVMEIAPRTRFVSTDRPDVGRFTWSPPSGRLHFGRVVGAGIALDLLSRRSG